MAQEGKCPLCQGSLVLEEKAMYGVTSPLWLRPLDMAMAWVCIQCSALFPVAVAWKRFSPLKPLYQEGNRQDG